MTNKLPPWSVSSMQTFFQCPRKWQARYILKTYKEPTQPHQQWGIDGHAALENRFKSQTALPETFAYLEPLCQSIETFPATMTLTEYKMGLTADLKQTTFFADDVWWRGVADLVLIGKDSALIADWKFGKRKVDFFQTELLSTALFARVPGLKRIKQMYVWAKFFSGPPGKGIPEKLIDSSSITAEQVPMVWQKTLPKVKLMQQAVESGVFHEKPGPLCGWCWLKECQHCPNK